MGNGEMNLPAGHRCGHIDQNHDLQDPHRICRTLLPDLWMTVKKARKFLARSVKGQRFIWTINKKRTSQLDECVSHSLVRRDGHLVAMRLSYKSKNVKNKTVLFQLFAYHRVVGRRGDNCILQWMSSGVMYTLPLRTGHSLSTVSGSRQTLTFKINIPV